MTTGTSGPELRDRAVPGRGQPAGAGRPESLTHREIVLVTANLTPSKRVPVRDVATVAERIRYAGNTPTTAEVEPVISRARVLLADLEAPA